MRKIFFLTLLLAVGMAMSGCLKTSEVTDKCLDNDAQIKQSSYYNNTFKELPLSSYKVYYKILRNDPTQLKPVDGSQISIKYRGKLLNGSVFDDTFKDTAYVFPLNPLSNTYVLPGLNEAVRQMQKGDSGIVLIPSCLAFGSADAYGGRVPAYSPVIFDNFVVSDIRTEEQLIDDYIVTKKYKTDSVAKFTSGLRVVSKALGTGDFPKNGQTVTVSYKGYLIPSGVFFDPVATQSNSKPSPSTISFTVGSTGIIKGWSEAVKTLKAGGTALWFLPSSLAYAEKGVSGSSVPVTIPGYAPLAFEVRLVSIQ